MKAKLIQVMCTSVWIICAPFACYFMLGVMRKTCSTYEETRWESMSNECEEVNHQIVIDVYAEHGWELPVR